MNTSRPKALFRKAVFRAAHRRGSPRAIAAAVLISLVATLSTSAQAYVGPGAGLGVIGTLLGIVAAIVLALFGLLWYPLKRAFGKNAVAGSARAAELPRPTTRSSASDTEKRDASAHARTVRHEAPAEERDGAR